MLRTLPIRIQKRIMYITILVLVIASIYENLYLYSIYYSKTVQIIFTIFVNIGTFQIFWSYYMTARSKPMSPPYPKNERTVIKFQNNLGFCDKCKSPKPERSHHCRLCGCTLKMDHHCPFTANCIDYFNFKAFILLNFYCSIFGACFLFNSFYYLFGSDSRDEGASFKEINWPNFILLITVTIILGYATFISTVLFLFDLLRVFNNVTGIEQKTKVNINLPWVKKFRSIYPNLYDLGLILNYFEVFGDNPLFWLIPIMPKHKIDWRMEGGCIFRKNLRNDEEFDRIYSQKAYTTKEKYFDLKSSKYPYTQVYYDPKTKISLPNYYK